MDSPHKHATDSPSKQLLLELGRLRLDAEENFHARLERETSEREKAHKAALAAAAIEHERVRRSAEAAAERFQLELEKEKKRREDEERRELDKKRQEKIERELADRRREIERAKMTEEEERRVAQARKAQAEAAAKLRLVRQQEEVEALRQREDAEQANQKARDAVAAAERTAVAEEQLLKKPIQASEPAILNTVPPTASHTISTIPQINPDREAEHQQYLAIHQRLKEMRRFMTAQGKLDPNLKKRMGDMRREIKKCVGQLTEGKGANKGPINQLMTVLKAAAATPTPTISIPQFLASPTSMTPDDPTTGPALLIYLLNIFSKAIISQFISEASVSPRAADPIGVVAVSVFAAPDFRWRTHTLISILLAKYHLVCPVLFGIYGREDTAAGKTRLGWWRDEESGAFIPLQRHTDRMTGLAAGFAALTLRDFSKSRLENPFPTTHYWRALAAIVNVRPEEASQTHFVVLKALVEGYEGRLLEFYGDAAKVALRKALVEFPKAVRESGMAGGGGVSARAVEVVADVLRRDRKLTLV